MEYKANNRKLEGENDQLKKDILDLKNQACNFIRLAVLKSKNSVSAVYGSDNSHNTLVPKLVRGREGCQKVVC